MKSRLTALFLLLSCVSSFAWWQSVSQVVLSSGGVTFSLTLPVGGHVENISGLGTVTFSSVAMGAADVNRVSVAAITWRDNPAAGTVVSVFIDGIMATQASGAATSNANLTSSDIWYADTKSPGNTSTSGNVVVAFSNLPTRATVALYRIVTTTVAPSGAVATSGAGAGLTTASLTIPSGGGALAIYGNRNGGSGNVAWTNATGDYTVAPIPTVTYSVGGGTVTATGTVSASITGGSIGDSLSASAWGP